MSTICRHKASKLKFTGLLLLFAVLSAHFAVPLSQFADLFSQFAVPLLGLQSSHHNLLFRLDISRSCLTICSPAFTICSPAFKICCSALTFRGPASQFAVLLSQFVVLPSHLLSCLDISRSCLTICSPACLHNWQFRFHNSFHNTLQAVDYPLPNLHYLTLQSDLSQFPHPQPLLIYMVTRILVQFPYSHISIPFLSSVFNQSFPLPSKPAPLVPH